MLKKIFKLKLKFITKNLQSQMALPSELIHKTKLPVTNTND
jgi:hypothetical protein